MKKIIIIATTLLFCILCFGEDLRFNKLTSKDGLSQSEITTFLKDSHGFMWIGSLDGLNRFDGYNITKFNVNKKEANSLSNNTIRALVEDKYGRIWVGTDDGLNVLLPDNQQFSSVKIPKSNSSFTIIYSLYINNNNLWIGTENGLFKANIASEDIQSIEKSIVEELVSIRKQSKNTKINRVLISSVGDIWIGGFGRTVCYKCDKNKNILHLKQLPDYITTKSTQYFVEDINKNNCLSA